VRVRRPPAPSAAEVHAASESAAAQTGQSDASEEEPES